MSPINRNPLPLGMGSIKKTFFFVFLILFLGMMTTTIVYGDSYTCSDVTTGTPTASQTQTCSNGTLQNGSAGELCPFSQTPCVQQTSTPQCQNGYTYNSSTGQCTETTTSTTNVTASGGLNNAGYYLIGVTASGNILTFYYISFNNFNFSFGSFNITLSGGVTASGGWSGNIISGGTWYADYLIGVTASGNILTFYYISYNSYGNPSFGSFNITLSGGVTASGGWSGNIISGGTADYLIGVTASGNILTFYYNSINGSSSSFNITLSGGTTITSTSTASPTCPSGTTLINGECVSPWTCPVSGNGGDSATCIEPSGSSSYYCSPYSCYTDSSGTNVSTTPVNATMPPTQTNNGTVTDSGCDGSVYLFPGTAMQCRSGGEQTAWQDCCNASTYLFGMLKCTTQEESVAKDLQYDTQYGANGYNNPNSYGGSGDAQYVGSYCSDKFFGLCLENMKVYCVFHSLLGLIIQEQGRAQLGIGFGSPQNPDCSGLTPTQFQELNFSNFDFTEYVTVLENKIKAGVINTNTLNQMQNYTTTITNQISNYENELSGVNP